MQVDYESNNFIGDGEYASYNILKHLTGLKQKSLKEFSREGIYKQVPIEWIIHKHDFKLLSESHQKGSIDLFLVLGQKKIAIRIQGNGHGNYLKGLGKAKHDKVQKELLQKYCSVVDILIQECPNIFKERVTENAVNEFKASFKTANVMIPISQEIQ